MNVPSEEAVSHWIPKVVGMDTGQRIRALYKLAKYAEGDKCPGTGSTSENSTLSG